MADALAIVNGLSGRQAVDLVKRIERKVTEALSDEELRKASDPNATQPFTGLDPGMTLDRDRSVTISMELLRGLVADKDLAPLVVEAWEESREDHSLFIVETVIAVGLVANLTLLMATSEIEFEVGKLKIKKGKANPQLVKAAFQPMVDVVKDLAKKVPLPR